MARIKITDSEGTDYYGNLPSGWHDTPLAPFVALTTAKTLPETCAATAELLGLPAEPFLDDVSLLVPIKRAAPWLFDGSLPDPLDYVPATIHHNGKQYQHAGSLDKVSAEQMEALLAFLREHEGNPLASAPSLLAVLYCPVGQKQTADVVEATAQAFATLDMAQAWPAIASFLRSGASAALHIRTALALESEMRNLLTVLETAVSTGGDSRISFLNMRRWLIRQWLRFAKKTLS